MFNKRTDEENPYWISFTDLMSGFMVIFILVSLFLFAKEEKKDPLKGKYAEMVSVFKEKFNHIPEIEVSDDATIRFLITQDSATILFMEGEEEPTPYCQDVLDTFIPIFYQEVLALLENSKDSFDIREIRIEGHTDSKGEYLDNLNLSSGRALKVQEYILKGLSKRSYTVKFQGFVKRNSIACGYSSSRLLDSASHHIIQSHLPEDRDKSRRVEFRVILEYKKL